MKVIVGIDSGCQYLQALQLLSRIQFRDVQLVMVHVRSEEEQSDARDVAHAARLASELGLSANVYSECGSPSEVLLSVARLEDADLIAIGSGAKGPFHAAIRGSVGRDLMLSWRGSLLVAKGDVVRTGTVSAVLGYDDSVPSRAALQRFVGWGATGFGHIEVVSVDPPLAAEFDGLRRQYEASTGTSVLADSAALVRILAQAAADKLASSGFRTSAKGVTGDVVSELRSAMLGSHSDLLILPAERHGFLDRLFFGSVSLAEAVGEHHSLLVIR
jgi:nucleotide-binding universal stress UspA family protein